MTERTAAGHGQITEPPERSSGRVWGLGVRVILVQVVALILLWVLQAVFAGG